MSITGKWRIVEMPDYQANYPDMVEPAYILFSESGGEFAFGCVTGAVHGIASGNACDFTWSGSDEMNEVCGDGWAASLTTASLRERSAFKAVMKRASLPVDGTIFQQPVSAPSSRRGNW